LTAPSPLAAEILNARPYAFLDDAPLEERRTQAVQSRRWGDIDTTDDFAQLDAEAIQSVREEAWPEARDADELHDALMSLGYLTATEVQRNPVWRELATALIAQRRATTLALSPRLAWGRGLGEGASVTDHFKSEALEASLTQSSPPTESVSGERAFVHVLGDIYIAAERLPQFAAIFAGARFDPPIAAPEEYAAMEWTAETALVDVLRARMTGLGPTTAAALAQDLGLPQSDIDLALVALEHDGFVLRGRFTPDARGEEWCERHLLARIHRYTIKRLRREIEPVDARDFMRFLFEWQRIAPGTQVSGPDALVAVLAQLEGFEAAAAAWENEILPARVAGYEISWLDDLCLAGRIVWTRLREPARARDDVDASRPRTGAGPVRATPIVLLQRRNMRTWNELGGDPANAPALSSRAQAVADTLREHGASFFDELLAATRLLHTELEDALAELVAAGLINSDSFAGLRALLVPPSRRPAPNRRRGRRTALLGIADAGRWSLLRRTSPDGDAKKDKNPQKQSAEAIEHIVRTLLKRYGVICWRLLAREAPWLPPWRELLRCCHRLEARGEIRGGRFIAGLTGEQFALPEAIAPLRSVRAKPRDGTLVSVCGADPLNLVGHLVAGVKLPTLTNARVLYRDGTPIATLVAGEFAPLEPMDEAAAWAAKTRLLRGEPAPLEVSEAEAAD